MSTQKHQVIAFLREHASQKFTAIEVAKGIVEMFPDYYSTKQEKYADEKAFLYQVRAQITSQIERIKSLDEHVIFDRTCRPMQISYTLES